MGITSYIIGISGGSGSGKTSFLHSLKEALVGKPITFISLDDYYIPRDQQQTDENGVKNFDLPGSIDSIKLAKDLNQLLSGEEVEIQQYDFNNVLAEKEMIRLKPAPIIIIEGLFIYHYKELESYFNLRLFVDANPVKKLVRRVRRDGIERNYPIDDVLYRYEHHVTPSFNQYIEPYKAKADLIINNNESFENALKVISAYVHNLIRAQA